MSKHPRSVDSSRQVAVRQGEGTLVDLRVTNFAGTRGDTGQMYSADLNGVPVPDRHYLTDVYSVLIDAHSTRFLFGQRKIGNDGLRSLLVVRMSPAATGRFLSSVDEVRNPTFQEIAQRENLTTELPATISEEPAQTIELPANYVLIAAVGSEACLDFCQISAFSLRAAQQSKKVGVEGVVRVEIRTSCLLGMLDLLNEARDAFPKDGLRVPM